MPTLTERMREVETQVAVSQERSENSAKQRADIMTSVNSLRYELVAFVTESNSARANLETKLDKLLSNGHSKPWVYGTAATGIGGGTGAAAIILIIEKFLGG